LQHSPLAETEDDFWHDPEALVRLLQGTTEVRSRHEFFRWVRSHLAGFVPHDVLCCGLYDHDRRGLEFDLFNTVVLTPEVSLAFTDAQSQLLHLLLPAWLSGGLKPKRIELPTVEHALTPLAGPWRAMASSGIAEVLVHGVARAGRSTEIESFFVFAASERRLLPQSANRLDVLMPTLHSAYARVQATQRDSGPMPLSASRKAATPLAPRNVRLTQRERQILAWVREGKNNSEIGEALSISALTVKNHVQNVLRKLEASNRTQAVAKATSLGLLGLTGSDSGFADLSGALQGAGPARADDGPSTGR